MDETDGFVKAPLYNMVMVPILYVFGTKLIVVRLFTLLLTLFAVFLFLRNKNLRTFGVFLSLFPLLEFHIFQFTHYALTDMVCISLILISLYFFLRSYQVNDHRKKIRFMILSVFISFLCYFTKISFTYVIVIAPASAFLIAIRESLLKRKVDLKDYRLPAISLLAAVILFSIYFVCWCLPNYSRINFVLTSQVTGFYASTVKLILLDAWSIFLERFWNCIFTINLFFFLLVIISTILIFTIKRIKFTHFPLLVFSLVWILYECTRMPMHYLPYRYLLGFMFAIGVILSTLFTEWTFHFGKLRYIFFGIAAVIGMLNMKNNFEAYTRRTFQLEKINDYLANYDLKNKTVIGAWASSVCWKNKAITKPVWLDYYNWIDPVNKNNAAVVVTETDESDSNEAYKKAGIDLNKISDSSRTFDVWRYQLALYWIKPVKEIRN